MKHNDVIIQIGNQEEIDQICNILEPISFAKWVGEPYTAQITLSLRWNMHMGKLVQAKGLESGNANIN